MWGHVFNSYSKNQAESEKELGKFGSAATTLAAALLGAAASAGVLVVAGKIALFMAANPRISARAIKKYIEKRKAGVSAEKAAKDVAISEGTIPALEKLFNLIEDYI